MFGYLRLEVARSLRDPRYVVLALVAPVGFYLLFSTLFGGPSAGPSAVYVQVGLMVSMSVFGAMWAVLSATGPRIAQDRSVGWLRQTRLLPVEQSSLLIARLLAALVLVGPTLGLVMLTARISHGVSLDAGQWIALIAVLWVAIIPIAIMGVAIGYATGAEVAFGIVYGLYMVLAALGGLWMPISIMPAGMQAFGKLLPSYRAADLGWHIAFGNAMDYSSVLYLLAWAALFSVIALYFSRRAMAAK
ncbi:MAG TPA: ABC transporter permease [Ktedonobacterales bacterium]|jgi:ABC-2 type transport system permease protein|nr:ABC transporter permease [Ktedonobacterales bacterium]